MNISIGQVYIDVGIRFSFSHLFQQYLQSLLTEHTSVSINHSDQPKGYDLMFRMSAKQGIQENEIKGPTVFKRDKSIEYSIFLPFDAITKHANHHYWALKHLFKGIYEVYDKYEFRYEFIKENEEKIIEKIISDKTMFYEE